MKSISRARTGVLEVEDVEARRRLIEPVAIAARVEAEQAAEQQPQRRLVRDDQHRSPACRRRFADDGEGAGQDGEAGLAALRRERERVLLLLDVLLGELLFHVGAGQPSQRP